MRKYWLASGDARSEVDLTDYVTEITEAVHSIIPLAHVEVSSRFYTVEPTPSQGEAIKIGRLICQTELARYCIKIPKLFCSERLKEKKEDEDGRKQEYHGGHH